MRPRPSRPCADWSLWGAQGQSTSVSIPRLSHNGMPPSTHSPRRQAPVTGSQESSWQLQACAQSTPWSPGGHVRLQLWGAQDQ